MNNYLIDQSPSKALVRFSIPMIIARFFQQIYTIVDSAVVGKFVGEKALASIGASFALTTIFICIAIGGGVGASVVISRYFGKKDYPRMKLAIYTAIFSFLILSILLSLFSLIFSKEILVILNTPEDVLDLAIIYLDIYFYGLPFLFMYNIISSLFNSLGESKIPLYFLIFSSTLNVFLDIYFVRDLGFGIKGAAYATLLAQGISAIFSLIIFLKLIKNFKIKSIGIFSFKELSKMSHLAIPSIVQQSTVTIGQVLVQSVVNSFGTEILAGFSAAMRVETLCIVPINAIGNATSAFSSQNLGARKLERIKKGLRISMLMVFTIAFIICLYLRLNYKEIISMFLNKNASKLSVQTGQAYLKFIAFFFSFVGLKMAVDGVLRGIGDVKVFTSANIVNLFIRVSLAEILAPKYGIAMVWYAVPLGWIANFIISFTYYKIVKRKDFKLII